MSCNVKPILRDLQSREIGLSAKSIIRFNQNIIRKLVCQNNTKFVKLKCLLDSKKRMHYESGRIFLENYRSCFTTCGFEGLPQNLYQVKLAEQPENIKDCLLCHINLVTDMTFPKDNDAFRSNLLALTEKDSLLRLDLDTGKVLQKIYLSDNTQFRYISWETVGHSVVLKSTAKTSRSAMFAFIILKVFPLRFVAHLEIDRNVFPANLQDALITDGLLMVYCRTAEGTTFIYSLPNILQNFRPILGDECEGFVEGIVGDRPCGLPVNVKVTSCPPLLFSVKCANNDLAFDGYPWQYITRLAQRHETFQVGTVNPPHPIANGILQYPDGQGLESEGAIFHHDDSGRIIHYGPKKFKVMKLSLTNDDEPIGELQVLYTIVVNESIPDFQRRLALRPEVERKLICFHYEDELDLITILVGVPHSRFSLRVSGEAHIYNNATGALIKAIKLDHSWEEDDEHTLILDCDVLVHITNSLLKHRTCYVYKLRRVYDS